MIRAGTIYQQEIDDAYIRNVTCPHCNFIVNAKLSRSVQTCTILFIPFIKSTVLYYSVCPCCNKKYILHRHEYNKILHSASQRDDWNRICSCSFEKEKEKLTKGIFRSPQNPAIAAILSLLLGFCGMQNLYMGHKKRFFINISLFILAILLFALTLALARVIPAELLAFPFALCIATNVYWGFIDFFRILSGHAKDLSGKYLLTNRRYKKRLSAHAQLHDKNFRYEEEQY